MLQLQIECHRDDMASLSLLLDETAPLSITFTDKQDDPILEPALGTMPLWSWVVVHALYENSEAAEKAMLILSTTHPSLHFTLEILPEQAWERISIQTVQPQLFGEKLWVCPSWITPPKPDAVNLILDPGLAFGTGTHPTTTLCLSWLERTDLTGKTLIDYGCGSGILALAALKLGTTKAIAVDIDEQAILATQNNATTNYLTGNRLTVGLPEIIAIASGDILIANILLAPLISLKQRFYQIIRPQGKLVVSGLLDHQCPELIHIYQTHFDHERTEIKDGWGLVTFSK